MFQKCEQFSYDIFFVFCDLGGPKWSPPTPPTPPHPPIHTHTTPHTTSPASMSKFPSRGKQYGKIKRLMIFYVFMKKSCLLLMLQKRVLALFVFSSKSISAIHMCVYIGICLGALRATNINDSRVAQGPEFDQAQSFIYLFL